MTDIIFADNTLQELKEEVLLLANKWRPRERKPIYGIGINDSDYMTQATTIYGAWQCPIYNKWVNMLARCFSETLHKRNPTYKDTQLHPDWLRFMAFRGWCLSNGWKSDYNLDKDFISNSKIYGPDTCAFIPSIVNTFITDCNIARGDYPIGVSIYRNSFQSHCSNPITKNNEYLGVYNTPEEAHNAWRQRKHQHALALADMYADLDPRVLHALRTRYKV